jgi:hypothetical protein
MLTNTGTVATITFCGGAKKDGPPCPPSSNTSGSNSGGSPSTGPHSRGQQIRDGPNGNGGAGAGPISAPLTNPRLRKEEVKLVAKSGVKPAPPPSPCPLNSPSCKRVVKGGVKPGPPPLPCPVTGCKRDTGGGGNAPPSGGGSGGSTPSCTQCANYPKGTPCVLPAVPANRGTSLGGSLGTC